MILKQSEAQAVDIFSLNKNFPQRQMSASISIDNEQLSDIHQGDVNAPEIDTRVSTEAPNEKDDISILRHDSYNKHDTEPHSLQTWKIQLLEETKSFKMKKFHAEVKTTYGLTLT